ncbi:MAG TPA: sigma-54 dependent transcriptional regulator [Nitrospiraceae bacterium]|nr:sigma-54 dependent transcriptional regulator [Nitrospiraceae bacterium]
MTRVLIIDDEQYVRLMLEQSLRDEGCAVVVAKDGNAGIEALQTQTFDCVITDLRMPGIDGLQVLRWVAEHQPGVDVIMLTGHGDVKDAVDAMKQGAWDFLIKDTPFDATSVKAAMAKLRTVRALRQENLAARRGGYQRDLIIEGSSPAWRALKAQIVKAASSKAPVLIQGETGSGKEVVARLLHDLSGRMEGPFLAINCGAMSRELLESELFGHEKGAFTGAVATKTGLVAAAAGGTLLLDELAEMPGPMQVSLLRFLDRGEYRPIGSTRTFHADVRMVAATNQNLEAAVREGRFREDLFYRLSAVILRIPALSERKEDVPALAEHFLHSLRAAGAPVRTLSAGAKTALCAYAWPGNIRELHNVIERLILMGTGTEIISAEDVMAVLPAMCRQSPAAEPAQCSLEDMERAHIARVLDAHAGNKTHAAKTLDIDYKTLLSKMKKYGLGG